MGIVPKFALKDVRSYMEQYASRAEEVVIRNLQRLGEQTIIKVRDRSGEESWYDKTGNLRSSIGYVVGRDGEVISEGGFSQVLNGSEGSSEGKRFAEELAAQLTGKYFLIIVAGMNYASYVEEMENKDVLASSSLFAEKELPKMVKRIENMLKNLK